jgi:hypothetical protein
MEWMGGEIWGGDISTPAPSPVVQNGRQSYYASSAYAYSDTRCLVYCWGSSMRLA